MAAVERHPPREASRNATLHAVVVKQTVARVGVVARAQATRGRPLWKGRGWRRRGMVADTDLGEHEVSRTRVRLAHDDKSASALRDHTAAARDSVARAAVRHVVAQRPSTLVSGGRRGVASRCADVDLEWREEATLAGVAARVEDDAADARAQRDLHRQVRVLLLLRRAEAARIA